MANGRAMIRPRGGINTCTTKTSGSPEEILAHVAEYTYLAERAKGRQQRRVIFRMIAARLRSPLYGYNPSLSEERAKSLLKWAMKQQS